VAKRRPIEIADPSSLTDADWEEINKLQRPYQRGDKAFSKAMDELAEVNPFRFLTVMSALFPEHVTAMIKDQMAAEGITYYDLKELNGQLERKLESPYREQ
jgi:hypothetical protein